MWVARDKCGTLSLFSAPVEKDEDYSSDMWVFVDKESDVEDKNEIMLDPSLFPEVKWEDEAPRKVKLVLEPIEIEPEVELEEP